jgi:hypothetical protein
MPIPTTDRAVDRKASATDVDPLVLVTGDSFPHGNTARRELPPMPVWRLRSLQRAADDHRSPWSADAAISGDTVL